ncbi:MAG: hypothetical protein FVQ83_17020 [Chloroflexi bacterium]|nr:hypothetical protein [Chloroflexota bacterium]
MRRPADLRDKFKRFGLEVGLFFLGAIIITWPLITQVGAALPLGSESTSTVPLLNLWTMGWNVESLTHGFESYWNAPIFYPVEGALAFADPQPLTALLAAPLWGLNPALAYNFALVVFLTLNGWSVYKVAQRHGTPTVPAIFCGLLGQILPFITHERGVLQLQPYFGILWAIEAMWEMLQLPRRETSILLGISVAVTFLTNGYYGLLLVLLLIPLGIKALFQWRDKDTWRIFFFAVLIAGLLILPVILPQNRILQKMDFQRSLGTIKNNSATIEDYFTPSSQTISGSIFLSGNYVKISLFPGLGVVLLGASGFLVGLRREKYRRWIIYIALTTLIAFLFSLGLNLHIGNWKPYNIFREYLPGFGNLQSPFRFGLWVQVSLILMASKTLGTLWKNDNRWQTMLLGFIAVIELMPLPARLSAVPHPLEFGGLQGPSIFLPYVDGTSAAAYNQTATWMVQTLPTEIELVNGYSGFFPPQNSELKWLMLDFPNEEGLAKLRELGVELIFVSADWVSSAQLSRLGSLTDGGDLRRMEDIEGYLVFRMDHSRR